MGLNEDVDCGICLGPVRDRVRYAKISNESWSNEGCPHSGHFCRACLQHYLRAQLSDGCWNIRCPSASCKYLLVEADINRILGGPSDSCMNGDVDLAELPSILCKDERSMLAAKYKMLRGADHGSHLRTVLRMQQDQQLEAGFGAWALQSCQACPRCLVIIRKETGCDHIQCRCGAGFCYGCGAPKDSTMAMELLGSEAHAAAKQCLCEQARGLLAPPNLCQWLQAAGMLEMRNSTA